LLSQPNEYSQPELGHVDNPFSNFDLVFFTQIEHARTAALRLLRLSRLFHTSHLNASSGARARVSGRVSMSNKGNEYWTNREKVELLVNVLQSGQQDFIPYLVHLVQENRLAQPQWLDVPLPEGE
jgi:hypothetical protein